MSEDEQIIELTPDSAVKGLNPEQEAAVTHDDGPQLIVAGAGTGKTMVITRRIAWLVATGKAKPEEILALTFTDKAAEEMEERVDKLMPMGYVDLWISTFHSFCQRILQDYGLHIGLTDDARLLNEVDQYLLIRNSFDRFDLDYYRPVGNPTRFVQALLKHFSRAKDEVVTPEEYVEFAKNRALDKDRSGSDGAEDDSRLQELADAYHTYQQLLLERGEMDFGDLNMYVLDLFKKRPAVLNELRQRFKYILVDEFQDTNWAQYELVKALAGDERNITVVGDDDQSIYKFRGASISNILQFKEDYPDSAECVITTNYRSLQKVLDTAYNFIQLNNPNRLEVKLGGEDGKGMSKRLTADRDGRAEVAHLHYATLKDEVQQVIGTISKIKEGAGEIAWSDFAILVRSHSHAEPFVAELQRRGIPFQYLALKGLYGKPVVLDCINYLKLLDNYHESSALYRILSSPVYSLPGADLIELTHIADNRKGESLYDAIKRRHELKDLSAEGLGVLDRLMRNLAEHSQSVRKEGVLNIAKRFLYESGYIEQLKSYDTLEKEENVNLIRQFLERIKRHEERHEDATLRSFMQELELERESGDMGTLAFDVNTGPDMVRVMTVHSSKGLEFPYIFIVNMVDQRFPTNRRGGEIELPDELTKEIIPEGDMHLEEERRLFYVAMTRAKDGLFLSSAEDYGGKRKKKPSRFLVELGFDKTPIAPSVQLLEDMKPKPEIDSGPPEYRPPSSFSFSQLEAYTKCPYQYRFAHVLRLPIFGKASMSFGKTMHATLEKFMTELVVRDGSEQENLFGDDGSGGVPVSQVELLEMYEECWIDDWYPGPKEKEEYRDLGKKMLVSFYESVTADRPKPHLLEQAFKIKIGGQTFRGKIDRIDSLPDGSHEIIDYKTGKPKEKLSKDDKRQLLLYQLAAGRVLGLKPTRLTFHFLKDDSRQTFIGADKDLSALEGEVEEIVAKIIAGDFTPSPGMQCKYCDFRGVCEFKAK
ncbi:MAG: ATP-dependent DNA helicase [Patescibacteria group bacterium]|nr:ATP-dependent DNA helicase [Patescibacteria group bacterium]